MQCQINTYTSNCSINFIIEQITIYDNLYQNNYAFTLTEIIYTGSIADTGTWLANSGGERVLHIPKTIIVTF